MKRLRSNRNRLNYREDDEMRSTTLAGLGLTVLLTVVGVQPLHAQAARGSEYSPTFVNEYPPGTPSGTTTTPKRPSMSDLHIVFTKGSVIVKDKGKAASVDRVTDQGNEVVFTFPDSSPLKPAAPQPPATPQPDGTPVTPPPQPAPESSFTPTFTHADPTFPPIQKWWWTHRVWKNHQIIDTPFTDAKGNVIYYPGNPGQLSSGG
jgi:hypothetical protein